MAAIPKSTIQKFFRGLNTCRYKSDFDRDFLTNYSLEHLYSLNTEQCIRFFTVRLKSLQQSDYDWTRISLVPNLNWSKSKQHANYHWYQLALKLSELTEKHITEIIFSGVVIAERDRAHLCNLKQFSTLIYTDNFERLVMLNRMLKLAETNSYNFANYDGNGDEYCVSPYELFQIRCKLESISFYRPIVIANWSEFREQYIALWAMQTPPVIFEDLIYPLHRMVEHYFEDLGTPGYVNSTYEVLQNFYKKHLAGLKSCEVNFFYGQCIKLGATRAETLYMQDIFLSLMDANDNLSAALTNMVHLAVWITHQNPAMVISHPDVLKIYYSEEIGPYLTQRKLGYELTRLLRFRHELSDVDFLHINTLRERLLFGDNESLEEEINPLHEGPVPEQVLFGDIRTIFNLRDEYNRTETFIDISSIGINNGSYQYVYHRIGVNSQYIRVGQLLQASGFLKRHGIDDYFQLLMPWLQSPADTVTGAYLSSNPLSHYTLPEKDPSYLIYLGNSVESHKANQTFYNVNTARAVPFSPKEFECIQLYAAHTFRKYPRIPRFTNYVLRASILKELVDLVNESLNYEAIQDGDGYKLHLGFSQCWTQIPEKVIEYEIEVHSISYQIRDSWNKECIHTDNIVFKSPAEYRAFLLSSPVQRLMFILHIATSRGHARANLSMSKYFKAYMAYNRFRAFYLELGIPDRERLDKVSMRYGATVRTFGEVWANGFPDCMSAASKWFSTLILDYLPEVGFRSDLEHNSKYSEYLLYARRDSQHLYKHYILNDLTDSIAQLTHRLTHVSVQVTSFAGLRAKGMELLGVKNEEALIKQGTARLLSIVDSVISPSLSQLSFFGLGKKGSPIESRIIHENISSSTTSESGSFDGVLEYHDDSTLDISDYNEGEMVSACSSIGIFSEKGSRSHSPRSSFSSEEGHSLVQHCGIEQQCGIKDPFISV